MGLSRTWLRKRARCRFFITAAASCRAMSPLLEGYEIESADFARLLDGVRKIQAAPLADLESFDWLVQVIRDVGLATLPDAGRAYEGEDEWLNASQQGVIQLPREFARYLQFVARYRPATYLEIGTANGATASLATAYLQRFNPALQATTIDPWPAFIFAAKIRDLLPLRYVVGQNSYSLAEEKFEAVFIDGDHSFEWAWADYQNVGRQARVCAFHDVNNSGYRELPMAGVCGVWELVKRDEGGPNVEFTEIFEHPTQEIMGIGVRVRRTSNT
jgi:hypothetical protein